MTTPYDEVSYPARLHVQAHPDRLATMGRLFGLDTPPPTGARILELGCGEGGNLIPAAYSLPGASFLGVDLSAAAVGKAATAARELGLTNVEVRAMDLREFPADAGEFDYVIAHGVYSWVPADVRARLLEICQRHLSPRGVAYVSFNTYPGHRLREVARDLMRFRTGGGADREGVERVRRSRDVLKAVAEGLAGDDVYNAVVRAELARVAEVDDRVLFHDDLSECNAPVYFHEFVADAGRRGLQYLSDAEYADTADRPVRPGLAKRLRELAGEDDVVAREQYADFLVGRAFRRTLLCHAGVKLSRPARAAALGGLRLAAHVLPAGPSDVAAPGVRKFRTDRGVTLSTNHPLAASALECLGRAWPASVAFADLVAAVGGTAGADSDALGGILLNAAAGRVLQFSLCASPLAVAAGEWPRASRLARWQAARGEMVTTLAGASVKLEGAIARELIVLLDGTHDRAALVDRLAEGVIAGKIPFAHASAAAGDVRAALQRGLGAQLERLAKLGLIESIP